MDGVLYEWIVVSGKKEYPLTETQYQYFMNNQDKKSVAFDNFSINPSYVSSSYKQKAKELKKIYPCKSCNHGYLYTETPETKVLKTVCGICHGTQIDLSQKPNTLLLED